LNDRAIVVVALVVLGFLACTIAVGWTVAVAGGHPFPSELGYILFGIVPSILVLIRADRLKAPEPPPPTLGKSRSFEIPAEQRDDAPKQNRRERDAVSS
jgi:hypothetical protein